MSESALSGINPAPRSSGESVETLPYVIRIATLVQYNDNGRERGSTCTLYNALLQVLLRPTTILLLWRNATTTCNNTLYRVQPTREHARKSKRRQRPKLRRGSRLKSGSIQFPAEAGSRYVACKGNATTVHAVTSGCSYAIDCSSS